MQFSFTGEQEEFRSVLRRFLEDKSPDAAVEATGRVKQAIALLEQHPHLGRQAHERGVRELSISRGKTGYIALYAFLIIFFSYFYTAVVFNPQETADNLKKYGGFVPGIRPGTATADYFDYVLTRLTTVGGLYLTAVALLPELLISNYGLPFYFGGTSILIVVSVTMDTVAQIVSHLQAHQYEGLIRKSKLRGARK